MNYKVVGKTIGHILVVEALFMLPSLILCIMDQEPDVAAAFLISVGITLALAAALILLGRRTTETFHAQEGFVTVALSWIVISVMGALPFFISGQIPNFIDALFETVSGFTTTGASILRDVEAMSRALLYWRSFTHWLGGMGILVFALAVVPSDKNAGGTLHLMRAESPGPSVGKLTPRLRQTAKVLYAIYVVLTVICVVFLLLGGMPVFDSLCTAFGTAGTGGFGVKGDSMVSYSPYLQGVCTVFMLLFGINFSLYYLLLLGRVREVLRDEELRLYLGYFAAATLLIAWDIRPLLESWGASLHHAAFQVSSIITTTGFASHDFNLWPPFSKAILLALMVLGACAGSTGGGIKSIRTVLLLKGLRRNIKRILRPRSVQVIQVNGELIEEEEMKGVNSYMAAYWILAGCSIIVVSLDEYSLESNISAVMSCFNNVGPAFDLAGPMSSYADFSPLSKVVLTLDMLLGRLEIFPILALFSRYSWSRKG